MEQAKALSGQEELFTDEKLLIPVIPDDPLLRMSYAIRTYFGSYD